MKKKLLKQALCLLLTAGMLLTSSPVTAFARTSEEQEDSIIQEARAAEEVTTITPDKTTGAINLFTYTTYSGKSWVPSSSEAYIDLGASDSRARECYYEISFVGSGINLFAIKSHNHGKVEYSVDGEHVQTVNLYNATRTAPQSVYSVSGLSDGVHTLKAVTLPETDSTSIVNQVSYAQITHAPYTPDDIDLTSSSYTLIAGESQNIGYAPVPDYTTFTDLTFASDDTSVATVSDDGLITAKAAGTTIITVASILAGFSKEITVTVTASPMLSGSIVDTDTQYTQDRYEEVKGLSVTKKSLSAWKNDKAVSELALLSRGVDAANVTLTASDLTSDTDSIPASNVSTVFIKSAKAYNGAYLGYGSTTRPVPEPTQSNRSESADILYQSAPLDILQNTLQPVWVEFSIPEDAKPGTYTGTITAEADNLDAPLVFTYQIQVQDAILPDASEFENGFDVELWQYPYSSAEYYGVEPFSEEHLKLMESTMLKYKEVGGHAITTSIVEEAWNGQTYSKNSVHYPSMVKWTKNSDGTFSYDYTDFDKWVTFNKELGIGDKIVLYSIAPWHNSFTYWENGTLKYEAYTVGSASYMRIWKDFLQNLIEHLMDKGWFDDAYIGIDERGFSAAAFDLIDSVKNIHGLSLKTAGAMDGFVSKKDLALRVTDLNVGDNAAAAHPDDFASLLESRKALGYRTTLYSCTEHQPGNFSLSAPVESYWSIINAGKMGTAGFLRWAYDAWVEDPLRDTTHNSFEPGDCFLIFPDEKDAAAPTSKSSVRLERIAEGVRDVNKLMLIAKETPSLKDEIKQAYANITITAGTNRSYLSSEKVAQLSAETDAFKQDLNALTEKYIALKATGTDQVDSLTIAEGANAEIYIGDSLQLNAVLTPDNLLNKEVTWTSSKPTAISVSSEGLVTAKKLGSAAITATSQQDPSKTASIQIQVVPKDIEASAKTAYYSFDEMEGTTITDAWGSRNGTSNGASLSEGKAGNALTVTEADKSAKLNGSAGLGDTWTVGFWVYSTASAEERNSILMSSDKNYSFDARLASDRPKAGVHVGTTAGSVLTYNYDFPANTWVHMAWTQDKTNGLSLYVNGSLIQTNAWTVGNNFPCPLDILGGTGFTGKIDELKVYNRVLTEAEVGIIMQVPGLNVAETTKELNAGETYSIDAVLVSELEDKTLTYTSNAPDVASVDEDGIVTAHKAGTAVILVENAAGGFSETVTITVTKKLNISNKLPVYPLDDKYLSVIDKDENNENGRRYLGQPDLVMLDDNKTLVTAYPVGHGKGPLVLKISYDAGKTWTEKTNLPESWKGSQETPTMYKLHLADGTQRLMLITACPGWGTDSAGYQTGWNTSYSDDGGETWTEYKHWHTNHPGGAANNAIVAMASLIQLKDEDGNYIQKWMGVYHNYGYVNYKTYLTFDEDGNEQWSAPEPYLSEYRSIESSYQMCEIGMFRSPDGNRIVGLARSQSHNNPATLIYSDDEGETWSRPMDLPGSLAGERHKALYDPISGRLVVTFREINYDQNGNNQFDGGNDWLAGDWGAWVGTYEDLMNQDEGEYRILLDEDWANNAKSGDTGYTGMVVQPDGTFILDTYGHWDKDFSMSWAGGVTTDLCYIHQAKFKLSDLEGDFGLRTGYTELYAAITEAVSIDGSQNYTQDSWTAFQNALEKAREMAARSDSAQADIDSAKDALVQAKNALKIDPTAPDKTALLKAISDAEAITSQGSYTDASWKIFQDALKQAKEIAQSNDCTQAQVNAAKDALVQAKDGLETKPVVIDKTALLQAISDAETIASQGSYTDASWKTFQDALKQAKEIADSKESTQTDVDSAKDALLQAKAGLETKPVVTDKTALLQAISDAEAITSQGSYTDASWKTFQDALKQAKEIAQSNDCTQAQANAAKDALLRAQDGLETKPVVTDKTALLQAISDAEAITSQSSYTDASWKAFQDALSNARKTLADSSSTQAALNAAADRLLKAQSGLQVRQATVLNPPASLKVTSARYDRLKITWSKAAGAAGYELYRSTKKNGAYSLIDTLKASQLSYTDQKLKTGTAYYYKVCAFTTEGGKTVKSAFSGTKSGKPVPAKPVLASAKNVPKKWARLKWKKVTGATGYEIYRSTRKNGKYKKVDTVRKGKVKTYTDKSKKLTLKKTYYYKIRAIRKVGKKKIAGPYSIIKPVKMKR